MKRKVIAGNWKMNKTIDEAEVFFKQLSEFGCKNETDGVEVIVCPPFPYLTIANDFLFETSFMTGAQDVSSRKSGAYTGEISAAILNSIEVPYCIIGHSERRQYHAETNELIREKFLRLRENNIIPIFCIGETGEERKTGNAFRIVENQLDEVINNIGVLKSQENTGFYIAYEPVWAIGTGITATAADAQEMHSYIRKWLEKNISQKIAVKIPILYGGSVKPSNLKELLSQKDIDGALIGGASLETDGFLNMINTTVELVKG